METEKGNFCYSRFSRTRPKFKDFPGPGIFFPQFQDFPGFSRTVVTLIFLCVFSFVFCVSTYTYLSLFNYFTYESMYLPIYLPTYLFIYAPTYRRCYLYTYLPNYSNYYVLTHPATSLLILLRPYSSCYVLIIPWSSFRIPRHCH